MSHSAITSNLALPEYYNLTLGLGITATALFAQIIVRVKHKLPTC